MKSKLGDVFEFQNGYGFKSEEYSPIPVESCEVLRMGYIDRGGEFKEDDKPVYAPETSKGNQERYKLQPCDLL